MNTHIKTALSALHYLILGWALVSAVTFGYIASRTKFRINYLTATIDYADEEELPPKRAK